MIIRNERLVNRLKDEYCTAKVEQMSVQQMRSYLFQIFSNDIAFADIEEIKKLIQRDFGEDFNEDLLTDFTLSRGETTEDKTAV